MNVNVKLHYNAAACLTKFFQQKYNPLLPNHLPYLFLRWWFTMIATTIIIDSDNDKIRLRHYSCALVPLVVEVMVATVIISYYLTISRKMDPLFTPR